MSRLAKRRRTKFVFFFQCETKTTGLTEEDETEQLKASVEFLVELCETVSPVSVLHYLLAFFWTNRMHLIFIIN